MTPNSPLSQSTVDGSIYGAINGVNRNFVLFANVATIDFTANANQTLFELTVQPLLVSLLAGSTLSYPDFTWAAGYAPNTGILKLATAPPTGAVVRVTIQSPPKPVTGIEVFWTVAGGDPPNPPAFLINGVHYALSGNTITFLTDNVPTGSDVISAQVWVN